MPTKRSAGGTGAGPGTRSASSQSSPSSRATTSIPKTPSDRASQETPRAEQAREGAAGKETAEETTKQRGATVRLPFVTARFEVPRGMDPRRMVRSVNPAGLARRLSSGVPSGPVRVGPVTVQSPGKAVYYAGLGALAVVEVVEWPVAAAIAAGTYVAQHTRGERSAVPHREGSEQPHGEGSERPETQSD